MPQLELPDCPSTLADAEFCLTKPASLRNMHAMELQLCSSVMLLFQVHC